MRDAECIGFLQWCLPRMGLRWPAYRKVRRTVCKRLRRRLRELELDDLDAYRARLEEVPGEWDRLDAFCRIPISRFYRDRGVFDLLGDVVLPDLAARAQARGEGTVRCWSAGCASGEEAYTLRLVWVERVAPDAPALDLAVLGTDVDEVLLERAERGCYKPGSLKRLPPGWVDRGFARFGDLRCVRVALREGVAFRLQDIRSEAPDGPFDLILCRNMAFTYFEPAGQERVMATLGAHLRPDGYLVLGKHERLPAGASGFVEVDGGSGVFRGH